jgi:hypothetical protein
MDVIIRHLVLATHNRRSAFLFALIALGIKVGYDSRPRTWGTAKYDRQESGTSPTLNVNPTPRVNACCTL